MYLVEVSESSRGLLTSTSYASSMLGLLGALGLCALLGAKAALLGKILWTRNCNGISGKTHILYTMAFAARYLDLVFTYYAYPIDISISKIILLLMTYSITFFVYFFYYNSYQSEHDTFRLELLLLPSLVLALLANYGPEINDVFWAFSVYLEAMAIIPQLHFITQARRVDSAVYTYVGLLTLYKSLHVMNEMYNHFYAPGHFDRISLAAGAVQLMLYCDFFTREEAVTKMTGLPGAAGSESTLGTGGQPHQAEFMHPKEAEAARSAAESALAIQQMDQLKEVVLSPSELISTPIDSLVNISTLPMVTEQFDKRTHVNLPTVA